MASVFDLVAMTVSSAPGTGSAIPLGTAATVNGVTYLSFALAGTAGGTSVDYSILDTAASEIGTATYTSSLTQLTARTPTKSTNGNAAINASSASVVLCSIRAETINTFFNFVTKQTFTSSGTYTATTGMLYGVAEGVGAGGGGGGCTTPTSGSNAAYGGGGGGSGSYSRLVITSTYSGSAVVIGSGGTGGSSNGTAGGDTVFGSSALTAKGGSGGLMGNSGQVGAGGAGGVAGVGDVTAVGAAGGPGLYFNLSSAALPTGMLMLFPTAAGGNSVFGGGAPGIGVAANAATNGSSGRLYGGGGGGGFVTGNTTNSGTGGSASNGFFVVTEFCKQ